METNFTPIDIKKFSQGKKSSLNIILFIMLIITIIVFALFAYIFLQKKQNKPAPIFPTKTPTMVPVAPTVAEVLPTISASSIPAIFPSIASSSPKIASPSPSLTTIPLLTPSGIIMPSLPVR